MFVSIVLSVFSCLFAGSITLAILYLGKEKSVYVFRLLFSTCLLLYLFSQGTGIYLFNVHLASGDWIYEIQEVALVFMTPTLAFYCSLAADLKHKKKFNAGIIGFSLLCCVSYGYGNYVNTGVWEYFYAVYNIRLGCILSMYWSFPFSAWCGTQPL